VIAAEDSLHYRQNTKNTHKTTHSFTHFSSSISLTSFSDFRILGGGARLWGGRHRDWPSGHGRRGLRPLLLLLLLLSFLRFLTTKNKNKNSRNQEIKTHTLIHSIFFPSLDFRILGVHAIGEGATEIVHIGQVVMAAGGSVHYFVDAVFNYPTLAEAYNVAAHNGLRNMGINV